MKKDRFLVSCAFISSCLAFQSLPIRNKGISRKRNVPVSLCNSYFDDEGEDLSDLLRSSSSAAMPRRQQAPTSAPSSFGYGFKDQTDDSDYLTELLSLEVAIEEEERNVSQPQVPVRFVNFNPNNPYDYRTAVVDQGTNLMKVADNLGVPIPRSCKSGLCGSCVADLVDPTWQDEASQPGKQTIRLCSIGAILPAGCDEMIIDCYRNGILSSSKEKIDSPRRVDAVAVGSDRFSDNWESEYQPDWAKKSQANVGVKSSPSERLDVNIAPEYDFGLELARLSKTRTKSTKARSLPISGSSNFKTGRLYAWYKGNIQTNNRAPKRSKTSNKDWTFHDIDRMLGGVYNPDSADGIPPWDRIW